MFFSAFLLIIRRFLDKVFYQQFFQRYFSYSIPLKFIDNIIYHRGCTQGTTGNNRLFEDEFTGRTRRTKLLYQRQNTSFSTGFFFLLYFLFTLLWFFLRACSRILLVTLFWYNCYLYKSWFDPSLDSANNLIKSCAVWPSSVLLHFCFNKRD